MRNLKSLTRNVLKYIFVFYISQLVTVSVYAVKAYPHPIVVTQPDGSTLTIQLHGDEFYNYRTTVDGYLLKQNSNEFYTYASIDSAGELVESQYIAKDISKRSVNEIQFVKSLSKAEQIPAIKSNFNRAKKVSLGEVRQKVFPKVGSPKTLVILVNFTDKSYVTLNSQIAFTNLLNQDAYSDNGATGSARDYFLSSSYGKFSPQFNVVGPYTLPHSIAYYGANSIDSKYVNAPDMIVDACNLAHSGGLDFTQYDTDNDGIIDNVFVVFAGYNEAEGASTNTVWPHRWSVVAGSNYSGTNESITYNGKLLRDYACTSELRGYSGSNMCGIGTFCHEFSHVLGLADYYHTTESKATLGNWSLMDVGNDLNLGRTPPTYSVFDRAYLGWLIPEEVNMPSDLTLLPIYQGKTQPANTQNQAYLLSEGNDEFFLLEYRKKTGWDAFLPNEGMLIWHIDFDALSWAYNTVNNYTGATQTELSHMRVFLESPGWLPAPNTPGYPFPSDVIDYFTPRTWAGKDIKRKISDIYKTEDEISFSVMKPQLTVNGELTDFTSIRGTPSVHQSVNVFVTDLLDNLILELPIGANFEIKLSTESVWGKKITITPINNNVDCVLNIRYNPNTMGNHVEFLDITSTGLDATGVLVGTANPVIITQVYGGGGNSGAAYKSDFIEFYNTTDSDIDISGWTVYYVAATSSSTTVKYEFPLNTRIKAGKHFALKCADGAGVQPAWNVTFDETSTMALSGSSGKVILLKSNAAFTLSTPPTLNEIINNTDFIDYVGYGTTAVPIWGSAMASNTTNNTSAKRKFLDGSYQYNQNIGNDFELVTANPRNSSITTNTVQNSITKIQVNLVNKTLFINGIENEKTLQIYNSIGLNVLSSETISKSISLNHLSNGIYFVKIGSDIFKIKL